MPTVTPVDYDEKIFWYVIVTGKGYKIRTFSADKRDISEKYFHTVVMYLSDKLRCEQKLD